MLSSKQILVLGAASAMGQSLVEYLKEQNNWVRGVDQDYPIESITTADEDLLLDLRSYKNCLRAMEGIDEIYHIVDTLDGAGLVVQGCSTTHKSSQITNSNITAAARQLGIENISIFVDGVFPSIQNQTQSAHL